jgi:hypothetical protein
MNQAGRIVQPEFFDVSTEGVSYPGNQKNNEDMKELSVDETP